MGELATHATTKFVVPGVGGDAIPRDALHARLDEAAKSPLTLLRAWPGSGRTSALAQWVRRLPGDSATWLSCDAGDADPRSLWESLVWALCLQFPDVDRGLLSLLDRPSWSPEGMAGAVVNQLIELEQQVVVVLDDAHLAGPAVSTLVPLVERLPDGARLVLSSRRALPIPRQRMVVRGELQELGPEAFDLSPDQVRELLARAGHPVGAAQAAQFAARTGGWLAAVVLSVRALDEGARTDDVLADPATSVPALHDFVLTDILGHEDPELREFLLAASVLERPRAAEARLVSGRDDAADRLREAESRGLFLVTGPDGAFRWHPLARNVLETETRRHEPAAVERRHEALATWYEDQGDPALAVRHAIRAGANGRAFQVVSAEVRAGSIGLLGNVAELAAEIRPIALHDPSGAAQYIVALGKLNDGRFDRARHWLVAAGELAIGPVLDGLDRLRSVLAILEGRSVLPISTASRSDGVKWTADAALAPVLMVASAWEERFAEGQAVADAYLSGGERSVVSDQLFFAARSYTLAAEGELDAAVEAAERSQLCAQQLDTVDPRTLMAVELAQGIVELERGGVHGATSHLEPILDARPATPVVESLAWLELARVRLAEQRLRDAGKCLRAAAEVAGLAADSPLLDLAASLEVQLALRADDADAASRATRRIRQPRRRGMALSRIALARGDAQGALRVLGEVGPPASPRHRIDLLVHQSRIHLAQGAEAAASATLAEALDLARAGRWIRPFLDDGPELAPLIAAQLRGARPSAHTRALRDGLRDAGALRPPEARASGLSHRELAVLRLLAGESNKREIAAQLFISLNTLKTHTRRIYQKLGVNSRMAAVHKATELGLISRRD